MPRRQAIEPTPDEQDLATWLGRVANEIRHAGMAVTGHATEHGRSGDTEYELLSDLAATLDRLAERIDLDRQRLYPRCQMLRVQELDRIAAQECSDGTVLSI